MISVLIPTRPDDIHAIFTSLALHEKGHRPVLWQMADFPVQQTHAFEVVKNKVDWQAEGVNFSINDNHFDVVWYRRPQKPTLDASIHEDDEANAKRECEMLLKTFWQVIAPDAMWINPPASVVPANSKLLQLKLAAEIGLKIPHTLIANDPEKIKNFLVRHQDMGVIYKTLYPMHWAGKEDARAMYTAEIQLHHLPSDLALQMTPGIFQEKVQKNYELRITYFGKYPIAVKLCSQEHPKGTMDWRYIPAKDLKIEPYNLPIEVHQKCTELMDRLGIVFGCFDFIVTPDQEYIFLEVNEAGQFLWVEDKNPDIKMLDIFTEFLISKDPAFSGPVNKNSICLRDFSKMAEDCLLKLRAAHADPDTLHIPA